MNKEKDRSDFLELLRKLESQGKMYGESDALTNMLGGEKFTRATRNIVSEMVYLVEENPEFIEMIPANLMVFFEGYKMNWPKPINVATTNWYTLSKLAGKDKPYSWVALELPEKVINKVKAFQKKIDKDDLHVDKKDWHGYGIEENPHITVKYGLETEDADEVKEALRGQSGGEVSFDDVEIFENDEHDVLVMRMRSKDLTRLHKTLKKNLKNEESYPVYKAHVTIAYLLVGKGEEYKKMAEEYFKDGFSFDFDSVFFEDTEDNRTDIPLS